MRIVTAALAALLLLAMSVRAQAANIDVFTSQEVAAIIAEAGGTDVQVAEGNGLTYINFKIGAQPYSYSLRLCDNTDKTKCAGLLMAMGFQMEPGFNLELFNNFNASVPFLTAVKLNNELMAFGRFVVSLGGVTRENVKSNMAFLALAPQLFMEFQKSQIVASIGPDGKPVAGMTPPKLVPVKLTSEQMKRLMDDALVAKVKLP